MITPDADGNECLVYFDTACGSHFFLNYEGLDFENFRGGTNTLTGVTVVRYPLNP